MKKKNFTPYPSRFDLRPKRVLDQDCYDSWRNQVIARDGRRCQLCNRIPKAIEVHHILCWESNPGLRYVVSNGVTLCRWCHRKRVNGHEKEWERFFTEKVAQKSSPAAQEIILAAMYGPPGAAQARASGTAPASPKE